MDLHIFSGAGNGLSTESRKIGPSTHSFENYETREYDEFLHWQFLEITLIGLYS
jgi:hypothetical protein